LAIPAVEQTLTASTTSHLPQVEVVTGLCPVTGRANNDRSPAPNMHIHKHTKFFQQIVCD